MANIKILTELESDLLAELFNIGVGRAADALSQMVNQEILLSVPSIEFMTTNEMTIKIGKSEKICGIGQEISGVLSAQSLLLFPESSSIEVVRQMLGDHLPDEVLLEMQQEAMNEIGNIVLNACIGSISNALGQSISVELPNFYFDETESLLAMAVKDTNDIVLFMTIDMTLTESEVVGYLAFLLGPMSLRSLQQQLKKILSATVGSL